MKKIVAGFMVLLVLSACKTGPAADQIQGTAVAQITALAKAATPYPTYTPQSTYTPLPTYTPAPTVVVTVQVTDTPTPVPSCTKPVTLAVKDGKVSYNGIAFSIEPVLAKSITAQDCPVVPYQTNEWWAAHPAYTSFKFSTDRQRINIYPELRVSKVAGDMQSYLYPLNSLSDLENTINHRPKPITWFDGSGLHVHQNYLDFSNGAGVRGVVESSQDDFLFLNNNLLYEFDGLTKDERYYVQVQFPIATSFLMDIEGPDPTTNVNPHAISIPNWSSDPYKEGAIIKTYNEEALRRFEKMSDSDFTPNLAALDALVESLEITSP